METFTIVDRFFQSSKELTDMRMTGDRDINTLNTFLTNLHSLNDRLNKTFDVSLSSYPEFKLLRMIRNYMHHQGDVDDIRVYVTQNQFSLTHVELIIIPTAVVARALLSFSEQCKNKPDFYRKEVDAISGFVDGFMYIEVDAEKFSMDPEFKIDNQMVRAGFDLFKSIYNITNYVADICRLNPELSGKQCVKSLGPEYTSDNNIDKFNMFTLPGNIPLLTTKGYVLRK